MEIRRGEKGKVAFSIRNMTEADLPACLEVQSACYPAAYHESVDPYHNRLLAAPDCQFVAIDSSTGALLGYGQSHPWLDDQEVPCLSDASVPDGVARSLSEGHKTFLVHDIATVVQGAGIGPSLMDAILAHARSKGYKQAFCVAVLGRDTLWAHWGFERVKEITEGYGDGVGVLMRLKLAED